MTLILLFHELWVRTFFFKELYEDYEEDIVMNNRNRIYSGNPVLVPVERLGYMNPFYRLFQPPHLLLPTTERLAELSIVAMQRGSFLWQGDDAYILNRHFAKKLIGDGMPDLFGKRRLSTVWQILKFLRG